MLFFNKLLGFRDFKKLDEIKKFISTNFNLDKDENIDIAAELLIFETTRQKTWILGTEERLFCVLDDVGKDTFNVRWVLTKDELINDKEIVLDISIDPSYKKETGLINFGQNHTKWLYSKKLFPSSDELHKKIIDLIEYKMLTNED